MISAALIVYQALQARASRRQSCSGGTFEAFAGDEDCLRIGRAARQVFIQAQLGHASITTTLKPTGISLPRNSGAKPTD
jgi:hypothetical protein